MLRVVLSRARRHVPGLIHGWQDLVPPSSSRLRAQCSCRYFSSDDDEKDTDLKNIYNDLFGSDDKAASSATSANPQRSGGGADARHQSRETSTETSTTSAATEATEIPEILWSDSLEISEERWHSKLEFDDIPDWSPDFVSRISKERVKVHADGIPTLSSLAQLALPPPPFPHPGHGKTKEYATLRKSFHYEYIQKEVAALAEPKISSILALPTWQEKQDAVDALFESVEFQLREKECILNGHPLFSKWVENALETYLRRVSKSEEAATQIGDDDSGAKEETAASSDDNDDDDDKQKSYPSLQEDKVASPIFMDCHSADDPSDQVVPQILAPLKPHTSGGPGRMVEEWELSAHDGTKRIMLRDSTRKIARALQESPSSRIFVSGRKGVGKSAALAAIVASARKSGHIVLYLPDGNRLHRHGYFVRPNPKIEGLFDLPILSQEVCKELLTSHESDMEGMQVDEEMMKHYFTDVQLEELEHSGGSMTLVDLLKVAESKVSLAAMSYTIAIQCLMSQEEKPFLMVLDEFNCYYEPGHYFHMDYDNDVRNAIPYDQINLFKPAMEAMALSLSDDPDDSPATPKSTMKKGGIVVGVSESCAVPRRVTDSLTAYAQRAESEGSPDVPLHVIEVPRFSDLEVDNILANFESIGIGNLRSDSGATVMNKDGIAYLRMVSSCVGQELLDVCCY